MYDENGQRYGFQYKNGSTTAYYYYIYNGQGDVIGILNSSGSLVAEYAYNAWGQHTAIRDGNGNPVSSSNTTHIANLNPFRYRGYYYDTESYFYYLNSRYYDAKTGRFINADEYITTGQGINSTNMFAYYGNNPISNADESGQLFGAIIGIGLVVTGIILACTSSSKVEPVSQAQNTIALGSIKTGKTKTGWKYNIHKQDDSTKAKKHIHIEKGKDKYSQNEDGSPHDGTTGSPPNSVKKELKEKGIWDWDANAEKYIKEVAVEIPNYAEEFPFLIAPGSVHGGALGAPATSPALPAVPSFSPVPSM